MTDDTSRAMDALVEVVDRMPVKWVCLHCGHSASTIPGSEIPGAEETALTDGIWLPVGYICSSCVEKAIG